jgi:hypothetical protein
MPFKRNAEIGRVAVVNYGAETGKLVVISDIVDQNRVGSEGWRLLLPMLRAAHSKLVRPLLCCTGSHRRKGALKWRPAAGQTP